MAAVEVELIKVCERMQPKVLVAGSVFFPQKFQSDSFGRTTVNPFNFF